MHLQSGRGYMVLLYCAAPVSGKEHWHSGRGFILSVLLPCAIVSLYFYKVCQRNPVQLIGCAFLAGKL